MSIRRISLAACGLWLLLAPIAQAQDCALKEMASLDMTDLPGGVFLVPVQINGASRMFLVDTGAVFSKLSQPIAEQLQLKARVLDSSDNTYMSNGQRLNKAVMVDSLLIGHNEAKNIRLVLDPTPAAPGIDGVLASDLLKFFDVDLDFGHKKFKLFSQDHCEGKVVYWTDAYVEVPFTMLSSSLITANHIKFPMTLDGHELTTVLDTGASMTVLMEPVAIKTFGLDADSPGAEKIADPEKTLLYRYTFQALTLNGVTVKHPSITVMANAAERTFRAEYTSKMDRDPIYGTSLDTQDLVLGEDVLRHLHVYIAYKERKLYVTGANASLPTPAPAPPPASAPTPPPQPAGH